MRKYAYLKEPLKCDEGHIYKVMLYEAEEGFYLFEYSSPDAVQCVADRCYDSLENLYEDWNGLIDERGWIEMEDPLPDCQHDAFIPLRVKGRDAGKPEWGRFETLKEGNWVDYQPADKPSIYEIYGTDAHEMTKALMKAAKIADRIPYGATIALKPNLILADTPNHGATTHAGVLSGCIEYLQGEGFSDISIIESSWVGAETVRSMKTCGYDKVCKKYGVKFYDLKKDQTRQVDTPLRQMEISCRALDADYLIDLPVLKGHCQTEMTCALKNLKGCLPDREKRRFHTEGLFEPIAALAAALKPSLVIVDSICGDLDYEEGGNPVQTNRMFLGTDSVQIDAYGCQLMGLDPEDVPYIGLAEQWGAGSSEVRQGDVVRLNEPAAGQEYPQPTGKVKKLTRSVHADSACSACFASLVRALYIADEEDLRIKDHIYIGQGYQGKVLEGIGIGRCCMGAETCVKGCPPTAGAILRLLRSDT